MELGERVRAVRVERRMTAAGLARASGLSKGFISQIESGRSNPSLSSLLRIATALDIPLATVLGDAGASNAAPHAALTGLKLFHNNPMVETGVAPSLTPLVAAGGGAIVRVELSRASTLIATNHTGPEGDTAFCFITEGEVRLRVGDDLAELRVGDAASWGADRRYRIDCTSDAATLLLALPPSSDLPLVVTHPRSTERSRSSATTPLEGPFRLVAMRAERAAQGSR